MKKKSTILMAGLFLSSSLLTGNSLMASAEELADKSNSKQLAKSYSKLDDLFSAITAVDSENFNPPEQPKSLRGTWQDYDNDLVNDFLSGEIMVINPSILETNKPWEKLTIDDKKGVPAVSLMFEKNKLKMRENNLITEEESKKSWADLSVERKKELPKNWLLPSREGLSETRTVGCGQFTEDQLKEVVSFITDYDDNQRAEKISSSNDFDLSYEQALGLVKNMRATEAITTPITIIDHREEPHLHLKLKKAVGRDFNGIVYDQNDVLLPMSLYAPGDAFSKGKNNFEVERVEGDLIKKVKKHGTISLSLITEKDKGFPTESQQKHFQMLQAYSEKCLAESLGLGYIRVPITDHHAIEGEDGDYLKIAFDSQPNGPYIIHHCRGGKGRTQTGMTTRDMMLNKRNENLDFSDYIFRHILIGGANLLGPLTGDPTKEWKKPQAYERAREIYNFYRYTQDATEGIRTLYRDWLKTRA